MGIPVERIISRLDGFFERNDAEGAKKHLEYWLSEAEITGDVRGRLSVMNELMGVCRKMGLKDEALSYAYGSKKNIEELGLENSNSGTAVLINCATVFSAFGKNDEAVECFGEAEKNAGNDGSLSGFVRASFYNNYAIALKNAGFAERSEECCLKALLYLETLAGSECEQAITYLNLADITEETAGLESGADEIGEYVSKAWNAFENAPEKNDGHYAFACEKCAPVFEYYGYFSYAEELKRRAAEIYEGD